MAQQHAPSRKILTSSGPIVGLRLEDKEEEKLVDVFLGIPYAKPPLGPLRFKKPEPHEGWSEVRQCTAFGFRSIQKEPPRAKAGATPPSEDCLTLNVFSPVWEPQDDEGFPILVYIHGGNYLSGGTSQLGYEEISQTLCRKGLIVVTIQYRLGYLGFWNLGTGSCKGNLALWDLTLALTWLHENLRQFNGNPDNVTVMGQSSGGTLADILALSPHSRHLVHKVILMSGNASTNWAFRDTHVDYCRKFAEEQGIDLSMDSEVIMGQLRELPAEKFALSLYEVPLGQEAHLGLSLDGDFIPKTVEELRRETSPKPYLMGLPTCDSLFSGLIASSQPESLKRVVAAIFQGFEVPLSVKEEYSQKIQQLEKEEGRPWAMIQAVTDKEFGVATMKVVVGNLERGANVFLYRFAYFNPAIFNVISAPIKGAVHCTDVSFVLGRVIGMPFEYTEEDKKVLHLVSTLWANFVKYGNPNGQGVPPLGEERWFPVCKEDRDRYLLITEEPKMGTSFFGGRPLWCLDQIRKYQSS